MKKITLLIAGLLALGISSCSDMIEVDSDSSLTLPEINSKADSIFYATGILQAMQLAADQYVLQNELRGDLVTPSQSNADLNLKSLANYSATASNKYDSAYVYYRVVNNCNYYLAHRDTALYNGSTNVVLDEYAAVLSFRAWAYLQLARQYGKVKFYTTPITKLSEVTDANYPELGIDEIVAQLAPEMERFSGYAVPNWGTVSVGRSPNGVSKSVTTSKCFIPIDVMLGEMYLETGRYPEAVKHYRNYLYEHELWMPEAYAGMRGLDMDHLPSDFNYSYQSGNGVSWSASRDEVISYIPMATTRLNGPTTNLPKLFGYNYYTTHSDSLYLENIQLLPSSSYAAQRDTAKYYYTIDRTDGEFGVANLGDQRYYANSTTRRWAESDSTAYYISTYTKADITLYRATTIWLHLAEALNRMGYPDAAFAILKDGMSMETNMQQDSKYSYLKPTTLEMLKSYNLFTEEINLTYGIHSHGAADVYGIYDYRTLYQFDTVVGEKLAQLSTEFGLNGFEPTGCLQDTINAVEDLLVDEAAMELAFEGCRYGDLVRVARRKTSAMNGVEGYPANFGGLWFANKLQGNNPVKDLSDEQNWYLPLK